MEGSLLSALLAGTSAGGGGVSPILVGAGAAVVGALVGALAYRFAFAGGSGADASVQRLSNHLDVPAESSAVHDRVTDLTDGVDDVLRAANDAGVVDTSQDRADALATLAREVSRGEVDIVADADRAPGGGDSASTRGGAGAGGGGAAGGGTGTVGAAAESVRQRQSPGSPLARELLDVMADEHVDRRTVEDTLADAVTELEAAHAVTRASDRAGDVSSPRGAETFAQRVREVDGDLAASLAPVASRLVDALEGDSASASSPDPSAVSALEAMCDAAERETSVSLSGSTTLERGEALASQVRDGEVSFETGGDPVPAAARSVGAQAEPTSAAASALLDALSDPAGNSAERIEGALTTAVGALDEHETTQRVLEDVSVADVTAVANEVKRELDPGNDVESTLLERVASLTERVERSSDANVVDRYVAHEELTFYRDTLLPALASGRSDDGGDASTASLLESVDERIGDVEGYYERREDHNHTIPRHFVSLARSLRDEGERLAGAEPERARGVLEASDAVLDHVESLYEQNQYSILLRRLRG